MDKDPIKQEWGCHWDMQSSLEEKKWVYGARPGRFISHDHSTNSSKEVCFRVLVHSRRTVDAEKRIYPLTAWEHEQMCIKIAAKLDDDANVTST